MNCLISVYLTTFNRSSLLIRAIDSVLSQTYQNWELIIVDDCSTDNTEEVVNQYIKKHKHIKYIKNETNIGACASRNKAINMAQGKFITGLDDDDYFLPNRLESFNNGWENKCNNVEILFSKYIFRRAADSYYYPKFFPYKKLNDVKQNDIFANFYLGSQVFTRTEHLVKIGGFDSAFSAWQDFECWYRLLSLGNAQLIDEYNYVVDVSHELTRISKADLNKIEESYQIFITKHHVENITDRHLIYARLHDYDNSFIKFKPSLNRLIHSPSRKSVKQFLYSLTHSESFR